MQVAFVSECVSFYRIISESLSKKYPQLSFVHYEHPDHFIEKPIPNFSHFILKLTDRESFDLKIKKIKTKKSQPVTIGLVIKREFKTLKSVKPYFDFIFNDSEIEEKLNIYFMNLLQADDNMNNAGRLEIETTKRKYVQLNTKLSYCLVLIAQNKTAKEISLELNKSERTIEKYITQLRHHFGVEKKKDLIEICRLIQAQ
jgi:DNA-binding CsgD family transcriptional regulator